MTAAAPDPRFAGDAEKFARQKRYRERIRDRAAQALVMEAALREIRDELDGNTKPLAVKLRALVDEALNERKAAE